MSARMSCAFTSSQLTIPSGLVLIEKIWTRQTDKAVNRARAAAVFRPFEGRLL